MPDRTSIMVSAPHPHGFDAIDRDQATEHRRWVERIPRLEGHANLGDILEGPEGGAEGAEVGAVVGAGQAIFVGAECKPSDALDPCALQNHLQIVLVPCFHLAAI